MAKLPDSSAFGQREVPRASRQVIDRAPDPTARAMQEFGQTLQQVGEQISAKDDEQAVFEARRKLDEWERTKLYDAQQGVVSKRGSDALDLPKTVPVEFDKFAGEVGATLTTNRQRDVFRQMAQARRNQVADFTIRHATTQKEIYEKGQFEADLASASDRASMLASNGDTNGAKAEIETAGLRITSFMKKRGASGEEISAALKTNSSKSHAAVIASMLSKGEATAAQAYLEANSGAMLQDDVTRVTGALKEGVARATSQTFATEVMAKDLPMTEALAMAREQFKAKPELAEAATREIKTRYAEKEASRVQEVKQVTTDAWSALMARGSMNAIPPATMDRLRKEAPEEERQMRDWLDAKWRRAKADAENKKSEDWSTYMMLQDMALTQPEKFTDPQTLLKAEPFLSKAQMGNLVGLRGQIERGDAKAMQSQRMVKTTVEMLKAEIAKAGVDLTPKDNEPKQVREERAAFFGALTMALQEKAQAKGQPLTEAEMRLEGMNLLREAIDTNSGVMGLFQTKKKGFQIATDPNIKPEANFVVARFDDIPADRRDALLGRLYPNGVPRSPYGGQLVTSEDKAKIEAAYTRAVRAGYYK